MIALKSEVTQLEFAAMPIDSPRAETRYIIATWYAPQKRWKIFPLDYASFKEAEIHAFALPSVRGHTHYSILEIKLGKD